MKYLKVIAAVFYAALAFIACSSDSSPRRDFKIGESKSYEASLFRQNCAVCHGSEGNGKQLADGTQVPSLRYGDAEKLSEAEIYNQIKEGKLPMPAFKNQLTEKEIRQMVQFVRRDLQGKPVETEK